MMDSQESTPVKGENLQPQAAPQEQAPVETSLNQANSDVAADKEAQAPAQQPDNTAVHKEYTTKKDVLKRVKEIAEKEDRPDKEEIERLKTIFYKLHIAERDAKQKQYIEDGGDPEKYQVLPDDDEEEFKAEMQIIKEKRAKIFQEQEAEKEANYKRKLEIIEQIKDMATSPEQANKSYQDFKKLQQEWKEIKAVPADKASELWRNYQLYVEQFYDLLKLNSEAREYDFKKNLEAKTRLCEAAEKLADEPDVISAFHQLQELHQQYREIGPVAKDLRESIWARFKAASTVINKRHQKHFEELRAQEEENLTKKTELCEKAEAINKEENHTAKDWDNHTKQIIDLQTEWRKIGFAPQKMNVKIFERFRGVCDDFFSRKAEYFKTLRQKFSENAEKKRALVEQAKALADSTEWKSTSDKLINLQKEWKTIGQTSKKVGDQLWSEFIGACNKFFDARNAAHAGTRNEEKANLEKKKQIIEELRTLADSATENIQERLQQLADEYNQTGHVPFKEKDKVYKAYHDAIDKVYDKWHISVAKKKLDNFKTNLKNVVKKGDDALDNERTRLMRRYEQLKQEITTYENNLGFLNVSSKKGNSLIDEMNRKVQKLKDDAELVKQKIKAIDAENSKKEE